MLSPATWRAEFDDRALHAQADAEEGDVAFARVADGLDLALHAPVAEAARHQDAVTVAEVIGRVGRRDFLGIDVAQVHGHAVGHPGVHQGFMQALVGFLEVHVFAHDGDGHPAHGVVEVVDESAPGRKVGVARGQAQHDGHFLVEAFVVEFERNLIHVFDVHRREHRVFVHVAEQGDLALDLGRDGLLAAAEDDVGLNADGQQFLDAVLGGLGFVFARRAQVGHQGEVDVQTVVAAHFGPQLAHGLQKGQALDVAHRAADFDDGHVRAGWPYRPDCVRYA